MDYKITGSPIGSVPKLASALGLSLKSLRVALALSEDQRYQEKEQPKADGTIRKVYKPHHKIRLVQRKINERLFSQPTIIKWPNYIYGSIPNGTDANENVIRKDYISCAEAHCGSKSVLRIDVKDFFDNVHADLVEHIFVNLFHYPSDVSEILTNICTHKNCLPQGGLTSGYLACLCLFDTEPVLVKRLRKKGLCYTRYVDDIVISSERSGYDFSFAKKQVIDMLHSKDLPVNEDKTYIQRLSSEPIIVHGLRIMYREARLPSDEVKKIRSAVKNIERVAAHPDYRTSNAYKKDFNKCMGRVNKLARVNHKQHKNLVSRLLRVQPLPSKSAVQRAKSLIRKLEHDYPLQHGSYWYKKRYFRAHERVNIINRSFPSIAKLLRDKLNPIKPTFQ